MVQQSQPILERLVNWRSVTVSASGSTVTSSPSVQNTSSSLPSCAANNTIPNDNECAPLFWQPGLQGYYFPRAVPGSNVTPPLPSDPVKLAARYSIYR